MSAIRGSVVTSFVVLIGRLMSTTAYAAEEPLIVKSSASAGCAANSWAPEVYTFYGDSAAVLKKVANVDMDLANRRIYAVLVESSEGAEFAAFESTEDKKVNVARWKGNTSGELREQLDKAILENKGVHCVGEQSKAVWMNRFGDNLKADKENVPAPANAKAAFGHLLQANDGRFIRVTIYLLC